VEPSQRCIDLLKEFEGCKLTAYRDGGGVLTIGFGHTGQDVLPGLTITRYRAEELMRHDLARTAAGVTQLVAGGAPTSQSQFDAMCSFAFNCGLDIDADTKAEGLGDSTLLRLHRAGHYQAAADQFLKWNKDNGRVIPGLTRRRARERALYLSK
jgi:lysozyme